ncbi:hypothetical protein PsorP6_009928 [Peronosclerospora sorghi]|uniref:Uncharacterized protein n=1 Tax=Peronosclerospora sorghi TaxID=230839 RepID=A0ACC0VWD9_9STRA|nr:hypothetical protein PsorP6_009928 [Peronosclerospora sorghi]
MKLLYGCGKARDLLNHRHICDLENEIESLKAELGRSNQNIPKQPDITKFWIIGGIILFIFIILYTSWEGGDASTLDTIANMTKEMTPEEIKLNFESDALKHMNSSSNPSQDLHYIWIDLHELRHGNKVKSRIQEQQRCSSRYTQPVLDRLLVEKSDIHQTNGVEKKLLGARWGACWIDKIAHGFQRKFVG